MANFHIPRVCNFDFMAIIDLRIYKGSDSENRPLFTVKSLTNIQLCLPHKIEIASPKIMRVCIWTEIWVLNVNLGFEISYDAS